MDIQTAFELYKEQSWQKALHICQQVLGDSPQDSDAWHIGGVCCKNLNDLDQAQDYLETATKLAPDNWEPWYNLALVYQDLGSWHASLSACDAGLEINPLAQQIKICLLINLAKLGQSENWQAEWQQVCLLDTTFGWDLVAQACEQQAWYAQAQQVYDQLIEREPQQALWWNNRASMYYKQNNIASALPDALQAQQLDPEQGWHNMAVCWQAQGNWGMSLACYNQEISRHPDSSQAWNNRSVVHHAQGNLDNALSDINRCLQLNPRNAAALNNRGTYYLDQQEYDLALGDLRQAITLEPQNCDVAFNMSIALFKTNNWHAAWSYWENRNVPHVLATTIAIYTGAQCLKNKKIAVIHEQGYGDSIQFARYISWLKQQGAEIWVIIPPELHRLFQGLEGCDRIQETLPTPQQVDYQVAMMSLPACMSSKWQFSPQTSCFNLDADNLLMWRPPKTITRRPQVGIAWRGNPNHKNNRNRNIDFKTLEPLFSLPCDFVVLHNTPLADWEQEIKNRYPNVTVLPEPIKDFADTAAVINYCDLVISVDTSVAHLAGAINTECWCLLPYNSCWRWGHHTDTTTPWYSNMSLYRQHQPGDWLGVVKQVAWNLLLRCQSSGSS
jgi:tetratricopeptide (TPR) repeat protein